MFSTAWNTHRDSELHGEEKREKGDRGDQEEKKGESKGERQIQPVISSLSVLHILEHTKRFTELGREEKRRRGKIEVTRRRRRGIKWGESKLASNQFPMCSPQSVTLREVHRVI